MLKIKVEFLGSAGIHKPIGRNVSIELEKGSTIYDLLKFIDTNYGVKLWELMVDPKTMKLNDQAVIFVNNFPVREKLTSELKDGDSVLIIPFVAC